MDDPEDVLPEHIWEAFARLRRMRLDRNAELVIEQFWQERAAYQELAFGIWDDVFDAYIRVVTFVHEFVEVFDAALPEDLRAESPHLARLLIDLGRNAVRVAWEILELAMGGYAQGALARWRTLHEIAITALFLEVHGEDTALRFWMHGNVERYRLLLAHAQSGEEPFSPEVVEEIEADYVSVRERWGADYCTPYGWAIQALGRRADFRAIEESIEDLPTGARWAYKWASQGIHPQVWGITTNLGSQDFDHESIVTGPSPVGLDLPLAQAAVSLVHCCIALGSAFPSDDVQIRIRTLQGLGESLNTELSSVGEVARDVPSQ